MKIPFDEMILAASQRGLSPRDFWALSFLEWRMIFLPQNQNFTRHDLDRLMQNLNEE